MKKNRVICMALALMCCFACVNVHAQENIESSFVEIKHVPTDYTGLVYDRGEDTLLYFVDGNFMESYTGYVHVETEDYYVLNGVAAMEGVYVDVMDSGQNLYYAENGKWNREYTGVVTIEGITYDVENGIVDTSWTGLKEIEGHLVYVEQGRIDWTLTDLVEIDGVVYYVENGMVSEADEQYVSDAEGMYYYRICAGTVDESFNGLAEVDGTSYYFLNGAAKRFTYVQTDEGYVISYDDGRVEELEEGTVLLAQAYSDENNEGTGGEAGNQSGSELVVTTWFDCDWDVVIRADDPTVAEIIATVMEQAVNNPHIGYDMVDRNTLYYFATKTNWDLSLITTDCETDCSALVSIALLAAGFSPSEVYVWGNLRTTYNLESAIVKHGGFTLYTSQEYTQSSASLQRGDIVLSTQKHVVVVVEA